MRRSRDQRILQGLRIAKEECCRTLNRMKETKPHGGGKCQRKICLDDDWRQQNMESLTTICKLLFTKKMFRAHKRRYFSPLPCQGLHMTLCVYLLSPLCLRLWFLFGFIVSLFLAIDLNNDRFALCVQYLISFP